MSTILEEVSFGYNERPRYSSYQLSKMVKEKTQQLNMTLLELSNYFSIEPGIINQILLGNKIFNTKMYRACSIILEKSVEELLENIRDDHSATSYRKKETKPTAGLETTIKISDRLFHEMICQRMIAAR